MCLCLRKMNSEDGQVYSVCIMIFSCFNNFTLMQSKHRQTKCEHRRRNSYRLQPSQLVSLYWFFFKLNKYFNMLFMYRTVNHIKRKNGEIDQPSQLLNSIMLIVLKLKQPLRNILGILNKNRVLKRFSSCRGRGWEIPLELIF